MMYKFTTQKFVDEVRQQTEKAYSEAFNGSRKTHYVLGLSSIAMLAYTDEFKLMTERITELETQLAAALAVIEAAAEVSE